MAVSSEYGFEWAEEDRRALAKRLHAAVEQGGCYCSFACEYYSQTETVQETYMTWLLDRFPSEGACLALRSRSASSLLPLRSPLHSLATMLATTLVLAAASTLVQAAAPTYIDPA